MSPFKRRASAVQSVQDPSLARCHCLSAITGVPFPSLSCHLFLAAEHSGGGGGGKCMPEEEEEEERLFIATKNQSVGYRAQGVGCRVGCVCACLILCRMCMHQKFFVLSKYFFCLMCMPKDDDHAVYCSFQKQTSYTFRGYVLNIGSTVSLMI